MTQDAPPSQGHWNRPREDRLHQSESQSLPTPKLPSEGSSEEPGPDQQYALQARKHIAALRRARPGIIVEIRWCPAHKGVEGNEKADEWAKVAAEEPDTHGVEWLNYSDRTEVRPMPLPRSLANLKREIAEKKWVEAR